MDISVRIIQSVDCIAWDTYVESHPRSTLYQLCGWKRIVEKTYGHKTYYLMAIRKNQQLSSQKVVGILPLVHLKNFLFGSSLISIPFFDMGGILADNEDIEKILLNEAIKLGKKLNVGNIELRHPQPLSWLKDFNATNPSNHGNPINPINPITNVTKSHKVRMILDLPESSESLMKSFKSKLRSQIIKPLKEGLYSKVGGSELLEDFYNVFSINMRDLGSPVHSITLMKNVLEEFTGRGKIVVIYKDTHPVACSMMVGFKDTLQNPWASALRQYSRLSPNMLLYWTMLEYGCDTMYAYFDFGRSSPDEGTYKFKKQWGSKSKPLHWHYIYLKNEPPDSAVDEKSKFDQAIRYWQKLPVSMTKFIGPMIRKHIGL